MNTVRLITVAGVERKLAQFNTQLNNLQQSIAELITEIESLPAPPDLSDYVKLEDLNDAIAQTAIVQHLIDSQAQILQWISDQSTPSPQLTSSYYSVLTSLNPWALLKLEDTDSSARDDDDMMIGTYSGSYLQQQPSLLSNAAGKSVQLNNGAILLSSQGVTAPSAYTLVCRFKASPTASGSLFGFSNVASFNPPNSWDRDIGFSGDQISAYLAMTNGAVTLNSSTSCRDNAAHTLVLRAGGGLPTALFIDGNKVAEQATATPLTYNGYWKLAWSYTHGYANGITMQGAAIFHAALTDAQIATIHAAV